VKRLSLRKILRGFYLTSFLFCAVNGLSAFAEGANSAKGSAEEKADYYVDTAFVIQNVKEGKAARKILEEEFQKRIFKAKEDEQLLLKEQADLQRQAPTMKEEAKAKRQADLQNRYVQWQKNTSAYQADLEKKEADLRDPIISKIEVTAHKLKAKKGIRRILEKRALVAPEPSEDLTQELIQMYDQTYSAKE
jgi:outer membrane protein